MSRCGGHCPVRFTNVKAFFMPLFLANCLDVEIFQMWEKSCQEWFITVSNLAGTVNISTHFQRGIAKRPIPIAVKTVEHGISPRSRCRYRLSTAGSPTARSNALWPPNPSCKHHHYHHHLAAANLTLHLQESTTDLLKKRKPLSTSCKLDQIPTDVVIRYCLVLVTECLLGQAIHEYLRNINAAINKGQVNRTHEVFDRYGMAD